MLPAVSNMAVASLKKCRKNAKKKNLLKESKREVTLTSVGKVMHYAGQNSYSEFLCMNYNIET